MAKEVTLREHLTRIGALGGAARAKPTLCERCGVEQPTARAAWIHCRKPRAPKKMAVGKAKEKPREESLGAQMVARRYANMTPEERSAAAKNAADKRWAKAKKKAKGKT